MMQIPIDDIDIDYTDPDFPPTIDVNVRQIAESDESNKLILTVMGLKTEGKVINLLSLRKCLHADC